MKKCDYLVGHKNVDKQEKHFFWYKVGIRNWMQDR